MVLLGLLSYRSWYLLSSLCFSVLSKYSTINIIKNKTEYFLLISTWLACGLWDWQYVSYSNITFLVPMFLLVRSPPSVQVIKCIDLSFEQKDNVFKSSWETHLEEMNKFPKKKKETAHHLCFSLFSLSFPVPPFPTPPPLLFLPCVQDLEQTLRPSLAD